MSCCIVSECRKFAAEGRSLRYSRKMGRHLTGKVAFDFDFEPALKDLINDIVHFQKLWQEFNKNTKNPYLFEFITNVLEQEQIGTHEASEKTRQILIDVLENRHPNKYATKDMQETRNLILGWQFLCDKIEEAKLYNNEYLIDTDMIKELHSILMSGIIDTNMNTAPGHYSTCPRTTVFRGQEHSYPVFYDELNAESAVQTVLDPYNDGIETIKNLKLKGHDKEATGKMLMAASFLLYNIVSLHPFSDGNGRLSRLLASYVLYLGTPFPSPISINKEKYIDALIFSRKQKSIRLYFPETAPAICEILIKTHWLSWKNFLSQTLGKNWENYDSSKRGVLSSLAS